MDKKGLQKLLEVQLFFASRTSGQCTRSTIQKTSQQPEKLFFDNGYLKITRIKTLITFGTLKDLLCNPSWRAKNSRRDVREQLDTTIGTMT